MQKRKIHNHEPNAVIDIPFGNWNFISGLLEVGRRIALSTLKWVILLLLVIFIYSCSSNSAKEKISEAENIIEEYPDSALVVLQGIDGRKLHGEIQARYALLLSQAYDKNYIDVTNDSLISIARDFYVDSDDEYHQMLSEFYYARVRENSGDFHTAIMSALNAERIAEQRADYLNLARIQSMLSYIYASTNNTLKAIEYEERDLENSRKAGREDWVANSMQVLAIRHMAHGNYERALEYVDSAITLGSITPVDAKSIIMMADIGLHHYHAADSIFIKMQDTSDELTSQDYICAAQAAYMTGKKAEYERRMSSGEKLASTRQDSIDLVCAKMDIALTEKNYKQAVDAQKVLIDYLNNSLKESTNNSIHLRQVDSEKYNAEKAAANYRLTQSRNRYIFVILILCILLLVTTILYIQRIYSQKMMWREAKFNAIVEEYDSLKERTNSITEDRDFLKGKSDAIARDYDFLKEKTLLLQEEKRSLESDLTLAISKSVMLQFKWVEEVGSIYLDVVNSKSDRKIAFAKLEKSLSNVRDEKFQRKIENQVNTHRNGLIERIRQNCPKLVDSEIRLIIYACAGLSTRTLAFILNKNENSVYNQKHRIKKKMELYYPTLLVEMAGVFS